MRIKLYIKHIHRFGFLGLLITISLLFSCHSKKVQNKKVIVVHARGISYPDMMEYIKNSEETGFFNQDITQSSIKKLHPINNAVTITNIASFETGTSPSKHGILGHIYATKKSDELSFVSGFSQRFSSETIWEKADKSGKNTLRIGALTAHGKSDKHQHVDTITQGKQNGKTQILKLKSNPYHDMIKYTNMEGQNKIQLQTGYANPVYFYKRNQSRELIIDNDYILSNGVISKLSYNSWSKFNDQENLNSKQSYDIKWISSASDSITLYLRSSFSNRGYPEKFIKNIDTHIGSVTGWPNIGHYTSQKIDLRTLLEEMYSEINHVMKLFNFSVINKNYDLVMLDYPLMDRIGHAFLRDRKSNKLIQDIYTDAFNKMNHDFESIQTFANQNGYDLIITSGHGFSPIHTTINIDMLLSKNGINTNIQKQDWQAIGVSGKVSAHIYLNNKLPANDQKILLKNIKNALQNTNHPDTHEPIVEKIYLKNELKDIGLQHKNSGDLFIMLNPGFVFSNPGTKTEDVFGQPTFKGDHGYSLNHDESFGILISNDNCNPCKSTDIAGIIGDTLELEMK